MNSIHCESLQKLHIKSTNFSCKPSTILEPNNTSDLPTLIQKSQYSTVIQVLKTKLAALPTFFSKRSNQQWYWLLIQQQQYTRSQSSMLRLPAPIQKSQSSTVVTKLKALPTLYQKKRINTQWNGFLPQQQQYTFYTRSWNLIFFTIWSWNIHRYYNL